MVLHAEKRQFAMAHPLAGAVIEVDGREREVTTGPSSSQRRSFEEYGYFLVPGFAPREIGEPLGGVDGDAVIGRDLLDLLDDVTLPEATKLDPTMLSILA